MSEKFTKFKKWINYIIGVAISVSLIIWLYVDVDFALLGKTIATRDLPPLLLAVALSLLSFIMQAVKWSYFFYNQGGGLRKRIRNFFPAVAIGHVFNTFLPLKAGEIAKPIFLARHLGLSKMYVFASCVADRFVDIVVLLLMALSVGIVNVSALMRFCNSISEQANWWWFIGLLALFLLVILIQKYFIALYGELKELVIHFKELSAKSIWAIFLLTSCVWVLIMLSNWILLQSMPLPKEVTGWETALYVTFFSVFAYIVPSAPASLGTLNAAFVFAIKASAVRENLQIDADMNQIFLLCSAMFYMVSLLPDIVVAVWVFIYRQYFSAAHKSSF